MDVILSYPLLPYVKPESPVTVHRLDSRASSAKEQAARCQAFGIRRRSSGAIMDSVGPWTPWEIGSIPVGIVVMRT